MRNSQKRLIGEYTYFITCKTYDNYQYFENEVLCELFLEELFLCKQLKKFKLHAFCLLYDHFHLMVTPDYEVCDLSKIMQFLKRHISRDINLLLEGKFQYNIARFDKLLVTDYEKEPGNEGDIRECRLQSIIIEFHGKLNNLSSSVKNKQFIPCFKWQKSYHDHAIRGLKDYQKHYDYTVTNYHKHKLPMDWKYISTNFEHLCEPFE